MTRQPLVSGDHPEQNTGHHEHDDGEHRSTAHDEGEDCERCADGSAKGTPYDLLASEAFDVRRKTGALEAPSD